MDRHLSDQYLSNELASVLLARAVGDAINPDRTAGTAVIGDALLQPVMLRAVKILAERGYRIERCAVDQVAA